MNDFLEKVRAFAVANPKVTVAVISFAAGALIVWAL